jgi:hypothetical protein
MCPERQILSVYFDNELCSPWKEKLETHLEECPACRAVLEAYGKTRENLNPGRTPAEGASPDFEDAKTRVWERLGQAPLDISGTNSGPHGVHIWSRSIRIPVPVAAAAGLVLALAFGLSLALRPAPPAAEPQLAGMGIDIEDMTPVSDMASLLQYLGSDTSADMIIITLPETTFRSNGEPKMLRAADYSGDDKTR